MPAVTDRASSTSRTSPLREMRRRRGLTGEELAASAGLALKTVYDAETSRVVPQRATLRVLAFALGCDPGELIDSKDAASPGTSRAAGEEAGGRGAHREA